jgi:hypothetical protein
VEVAAVEVAEEEVVVVAVQFHVRLDAPQP